MSDLDPNGVPRVVVVGAGVAALEFLLGLAELAPGRAAVDVVAPETYFTYRPLSVAQTFGVGGPYHLELDRVISHVGARHVPTLIASVDTSARVAYTAAGEVVPYDVLVVAPGARTEAALPGALTFHGSSNEHAVRALLADLDARPSRRSPSWPRRESAVLPCTNSRC